MIKGIELYTNQAGDIAVYENDDVITLYHWQDNKAVAVKSIDISDYISDYAHYDLLYTLYANKHPEEIHSDWYLEDGDDYEVWDIAKECIVNELLGVPKDDQLPF